MHMIPRRSLVLLWITLSCLWAGAGYVALASGMSVHSPAMAGWLGAGAVAAIILVGVTLWRLTISSGAEHSDRAG
jgi:hypothetical protein